MARGFLYVATRPSAAEREGEYNTWYDQVHLPEVCSLPGFISGQRFAPVGDDGPYVAMYEIEGDDLSAVVKGMLKAAMNGTLNMSDALQMSPPPEIRILRLTASA